MVNCEHIKLISMTFTKKRHSLRKNIFKKLNILKTSHLIGGYFKSILIIVFSKFHICQMKKLSNKANAPVITNLLKMSSNLIFAFLMKLLAYFYEALLKYQSRCWDSQSGNIFPFLLLEFKVFTLLFRKWDCASNWELIYKCKNQNMILRINNFC